MGLKLLFQTLLALSLMAGLAAGHAVDFAKCQSPTSNALKSCPKGTVVVGADTEVASFQTIQGAIDALPDNEAPYTILVLSGNYTEQLNVTRQAPVTLLGQTTNPRSRAQNLVTVSWASANGRNSGFDDNAYTSVLTVAPTLNASLVGSGPTGFNVSKDTPFGSSDFRVYNINFQNTFAQQTAGPSHAVGVSRANAGFYFCGFYSYQDSVYIGHLGNAYFYANEIAGEVDFLYGFGTAWIESSNLTLRGCGGGIIAWKGTNTTFPNKYGCYVSNSYIRGANESVVESNRGKCSLGRPWNNLHTSVYINTFMDASIRPQGYTGWGSPTPPNSTFMAEYGSYGPGWSLEGRLDGNATRVLSRHAVRPYHQPKSVFMKADGSQPYVHWIDKRLSSPWVGT
ncbi:hypothetical protein ACJZ2D_011633 [Fusarium nematophilum]